MQRFEHAFTHFSEKVKLKRASDLVTFEIYRSILRLEVKIIQHLKKDKKEYTVHIHKKNLLN